VNVTVLYFAALRDVMGLSEESVTLPSDVRTAADFLRFLEGERSALTGRLKSVRLARNEAFAAPEEVLAAGDVLALIPPVAGG
jgi:molybdopterin synthase sulfur carrier subunit